MAADLVLMLTRMSLAAGLAIACLLAARPLIRRWCGPDVVYTLWCLPPVSVLAMVIEMPFEKRLLAPVSPVLAGHAGLLLAVWAAGVVMGIGVLALSQRRIMRLARRGELGPAVTGLFRPRLYLPATFADDFDAAERSVIRSHERAHLLRHDALANYALALGQCLFWFNPLVHVGAAYLRRDQEMACDFTVMEERPDQRGLYARTMLKTQLFGPQVRLGCGWARHPLEERVKALGETPPVSLRIAGILGLSVAAFQLMVLFSLFVTH